MTASANAAARHARPALREPMVWLVILLPIASMVFAFWLLSAAIGSGGADEVGGDVHATADVQVADLGPDARAHALGLVAVLHADGKGVDVFPAQGSFERTRPLVLTLRHPTDAHRDLRLVLAAGVAGWHFGDGLDASHDWVVQLMPADGSWRLGGRLRTGLHAARLEPAVAGE